MTPPRAPLPDTHDDRPLYYADGLRGDLAGNRDDRQRKLERMLSKPALDVIDRVEAEQLDRHAAPHDERTRPMTLDARAGWVRRVIERILACL